MVRIGSHRLAPVSTLYVGRERVRVQTLAGAAVVVDARILRTLASISHFEPLESIALRLQRATGLAPEALHRELDRLATAGVLLSSATLRAGAKAAAPPNTEIACLSVPTRGRTAALERCLASYANMATRSGRRPELVVVDDSHDGAERDSNQRALARIAANHGLIARYCSGVEKHAFAATLGARVSGGPALLELALLDPENVGHSTGANRNAQLLDAVGRCVLSVDDDTVARTVVTGDGGLRVSRAPDPTRVHLSSSRVRLLSELAEAPSDLFGAHAAVLGRSPGQLLQACAPSELQLEGASTRWLRQALSGNGRVAVTWTGIYGDCGAASAEHHVFHDDFVRAQLTASEDDFRALRRTREIARTVARLTVGDGVYCQSTAIGLDARSLLPPFFPVLRGQDVVFGATLRACFEEASIAYLPLGILHDPVDARDAGPDDSAPMRPWATFMYVLAAVDTFASAPPVGVGADRLRALGWHLIASSGLSASDFADLMRRYFNSVVAQQIDAFERALGQSGGKPAYWARDVERYVRRLVELAESDAFLHPKDAPASVAPGTALSWVQRLLRRYGELLVSWPELWEAAREMSVDGHRISRPVVG